MKKQKKKKKKNWRNMAPTSENQKYLFLVNNDKQHQQTLIFQIKISFSRKLKDRKQYFCMLF